MKKSLIFILFLLFFNGSFFNPTLDTENIELDIKRLENEKILVEWSINFEDYDGIVLQISHVYLQVWICIFTMDLKIH